MQKRSKTLLSATLRWLDTQQELQDVPEISLIPSSRASMAKLKIKKVLAKWAFLVAAHVGQLTDLVQ